ncbi:asparaginase [Wukongibacter baidiensis]|uniref:asparaginase n=1 Tax=Wukongibacter baidiensis TaxID=1723361 RepID=UPI003D7F59EF
MKRILIIATGGTIASSDEGNGLTPHYDVSELLSFVPHVKDKCSVTGKMIMNIDSSNMTPSCWLEIAKAIEADYEEYDGFVITHGTDTMAYSSAALTYMLQGLNKPVILTGSQYSIEERCTDAMQNFNDAIIFAMEDIAGVFVVFDGKLICGTRAMKVKTKSYDAFESVNFPYIAEIKHDRITYNKYILRYFKPGFDTFNVRDKVCDNVAVIKLFPGIDPELFSFIQSRYKGVIIESFGIGGIPFENKDIISKVGKMTDANMAVVVTTQCLEEGVDLGIYEVGKKLPANKIIYASDINTEALVAKLMCGLGMSEDIAEVKKFIETPIMFDINTDC